MRVFGCVSPYRRTLATHPLTGENLTHPSQLCWAWGSVLCWLRTFILPFPRLILWCMSDGKADPPEEITSFTSGPKELDMIFSKRTRQSDLRVTLKCLGHPSLWRLRIFVARLQRLPRTLEVFARPLYFSCVCAVRSLCRVDLGEREVFVRMYRVATHRWPSHTSGTLLLSRQPRYCTSFGISFLRKSYFFYKNGL